MNGKVTIGKAARETGLTAKAIRFYENGGFVRPATRSESGYRLYAAADIERLRLLRRARELGVPLPDIKALLEKAAAADCATVVDHLSRLLAEQREAIAHRIAELQALQEDLDRVEDHLRHCE